MVRLSQKLLGSRRRRSRVLQFAGKRRLEIIDADLELSWDEAQLKKRGKMLNELACHYRTANAIAAVDLKLPDEITLLVYEFVVTPHIQDQTGYLAKREGFDRTDTCA
jgi:hypothetical protein